MSNMNPTTSRRPQTSITASSNIGNIVSVGTSSGGNIASIMKSFITRRSQTPCHSLSLMVEWVWVRGLDMDESNGNP
jgi:hypothetical protein